MTLFNRYLSVRNYRIMGVGTIGKYEVGGKHHIISAYLLLTCVFEKKCQRFLRTWQVRAGR